MDHTEQILKIVDDFIKYTVPAIAAAISLWARRSKPAPKAKKPPARLKARTPK